MLGEREQQRSRPLRGSGFVASDELNALVIYPVVVCDGG
jgi:hypothetical protein